MGIEEIRKLKEQAKLPKEPKKRKPIPKNGKNKKPPKGTADLNRWFDDRRLEMAGRCMHCGGPTSRKSDVYYKFCIAHILPKALFKSVETHPLNWIELCHFSGNGANSCHTNMDHHMLDIIELNCFNTVIERFVAMYPSIAAKERKYIPDALLQYINT